MASAAEQLARNLNFSTFSKAKVLQQRILFTLGALLVYRLGTYIPVPGIDPQAYAQTFQQAQSGIFGMFDLFAGGAVHRMAVFALNLIPYITASIVVQVISTASPRLEALKKEGEAGRRKMNQYTRYLAVLFCAIQAYGIAIGLEGSQGVVLNPGWFFRISTIVTLVFVPALLSLMMDLRAHLFPEQAAESAAPAELADDERYPEAEVVRADRIKVG